MSVGKEVNSRLRLGGSRGVTDPIPGCDVDIIAEMVSEQGAAKRDERPRRLGPDRRPTVKDGGRGQRGEESGNAAPKKQRAMGVMLVGDDNGNPAAAVASAIMSSAAWKKGLRYHHRQGLTDASQPVRIRSHFHLIPCSLSQIEGALIPV